MNFEETDVNNTNQGLQAGDMLEQVYLYIEENQILTSKWQARLTTDLKKDGIALSVLSGTAWEKCCKFLTNTVKEVEKGYIFVTDCEEKAVWIAAKGYPVLGCLHEKNRHKAFNGVRYLTDPEGVEAGYLDKVYRRYAGIPWRILETPRCIIRETTTEDVDAFYRIYADASITQYMENLFADKTDELRYVEQYRKNMYEFYGFGIWTVLLKETGEVIGRAGYDLREGYEEPELGFVIGKPWQGRGLAKEVCSAILLYGAAELGFETVQAMVASENTVSRALLKTLGFAPVGKCPENFIRYLFTLHPEERQNLLHRYGP